MCGVVGTYLGLPSVVYRKNSNDFCFVKENVWKALQGWKRQLFSMAGKETLIKSVGQAVPTYTMSVFKLPKSFCLEITSYFARFWWRSNDVSRKIHWMRWEKMCLPKERGGVNFRDLEGFNKALLAKQARRVLCNPNLLVSRVLASRYLPLSNLLKAIQDSKGSFFWRSLLCGRELLKEGLRKRMGDGCSIKVFEDKWIPRESTFRTMSPSISNRGALVADFITRSGEWDAAKLGSNMCPEDVEVIMKIPLSKVNMQDVWIWHYDKEGNYSVKSGYKLYMNLSFCGASPSDNRQSKVWKRLWQLKIPPKIRLFLWKAFQNCILTKANLIQRGMDVVPLCPVYSKKAETGVHALLDYSRGHQIWQACVASLDRKIRADTDLLNRWESEIEEFEIEQ